MFKSLILPIILISVFIIIGLYELVIVFNYLLSIDNKTKYENIACVYTIIKSVLNLLYAIYILRTDFLKKKEDKIWDKLKMLIFVINIWGVVLYNDNLKKYGIFIPVIIIEFVIFMIIISLIIFVICTKDTRSKDLIIINENECPVVINIPQLAVPVNIELTNLYVPQATPVNINLGTVI